MQWRYLVTVPFAFILMAGRAPENWLGDVDNHRGGNPLITQVVIGADA